MAFTRRDFVKMIAAAAPLTHRAAVPTDASSSSQDRSSERVTQDREGVIRWKADQKEVALFGANYCLPSASDYRAAGYVGSDRKRLIEQDMAHFARMGWDGLRLSFWGDWENCDPQGNLIVNDHLDLLDFLIARATDRGIYMLFSPIVTYSSLWPDKTDDPAVIGFSRQFEKSELGTNPAAIAAQVRYLQQLLRHVNPYTGVALKDEPNILFIEMVNEPWHHSADFEGSVRYIDTLVDAVRSVGCEKLLFHNVSQDFGMAKPIRASKVQGSTFGWYPSGLDMRGALHGNFLRAVDDYPKMRLPELEGKAKVVYEFDMPDVMSGYHYPAMARAFREGGAQFAAMFSYDMLTTAPYNLGWQVHCLNMVYTPQKAVSAIIAGEAMRRLPRLRSYGAYPHNTHFGDFQVSYEENLSEMRTEQAFLYSNDTAQTPLSPTTLRRIVGFGSSPVVRYQGRGPYFLDKIEEGVWRLEVYPDAVQIDDPFAAPRMDRTVFRLIERIWPMRVRLADLGPSFRVAPLNRGNDHATRARAGRFPVKPGVFLLTAANKTDPGSLPAHVGRVGLREFVCPSAKGGPPSLVAAVQETYVTNRKMRFAVDVFGSETPQAVLLHVLPSGRAAALEFPLSAAGGYTYQVILPPGTLPAGKLEYWFQVKDAASTLTIPQEADPASTVQPSHAFAVGTAEVVAPHAPLTLFDPSRDLHRLDLSRSADQSRELVLSAQGQAKEKRVYRFHLPSTQSNGPGEAAASLYIGDRIAERGAAIRAAKAISATMRAPAGETVIHIALVEKDGTAWGSAVKVSPEGNTVVAPLAAMTPTAWALLPQGFPGSRDYEATSTRTTGRIDLRNIERLQFSLHLKDQQEEQKNEKESLKANVKEGVNHEATKRAGATVEVEIESIALTFGI